jgi:predicted kinase
MRQWMRERMRRRTKRGPNESEATGKIGQEIPSGQPTPLQPAYPEDPRGTSAASTPADGAGDKAKSRGVAGKLIDKLIHKPPAKPGSKPMPRPAQDVHAPGVHKDLQEESVGSAGEAAGREDSPIHGRNESAEAEHAVDTARVVDAAAGSNQDARIQDTGQEGRLVVETQPESPSLPPPELPPANPKNLKGFVVLAIGLPGSGKTTWFKRRGVMPLSSDMLRSILFDDITEQRYQGLVFSTLRSLLRARLIAKMPWNYVDATNLSPHERRQWIKMAKSFGYDVQAVFFDVPFEVCLERNRRRERIVSEEIMKKMAERLRPPSFKEGFSKITMVRVKGAAPAKREEGSEEPVS